MSAPSRVDDGNFSLAKQVGEPEISYPFADHGDVTAWVYRIKMRQNQSDFSPLTPMSYLETSIGYGYLVEPENTTRIGQGLVEWDRVVANVPSTRRVPGGTITYAVQCLITVATVPVVPYEIEEFPITLDSEIEYSYSLTKPDVVYAPKIFSALRGLTLVNIGGWGIAAVGDEILAMDSENSLYMGLIYQTKKVYVKQPFGTPE